MLDKIILSTDCEIIAKSVTNHRIHIPYLRPARLAQDSTPTFEVVKHIVEYFDFIEEYYDNICLLQPTCPFREEGFIDQCFEHFVTTGADSLFSVRKVPHEYNPHWVFEPGDDGFVKIATGDKNIIPSRQKLPEAFARDGSVYIFKTNNIRKYQNLYGKKMTSLESKNLLHVNIDTKEDWVKAEMIANMECSVN